MLQKSLGGPSPERRVPWGYKTLKLGTNKLNLDFKLVPEKNFDATILVPREIDQ